MFRTWLLSPTSRSPEMCCPPGRNSNVQPPLKRTHPVAGVDLVVRVHLADDAADADDAHRPSGSRSCPTSAPFLCVISLRPEGHASGPRDQERVPAVECTVPGKLIASSCRNCRTSGRERPRSHTPSATCPQWSPQRCRSACPPARPWLAELRHHPNCQSAGL
jgi:hypothetical protein